MSSRGAGPSRPIAAVLAGQWWVVPPGADEWAHQQHEADAAVAVDDSGNTNAGGDESPTTGNSTAPVRDAVDDALAAAAQREQRRFLVPEFWQSPMLQPHVQRAAFGATVANARSIARVAAQQTTTSTTSGAESALRASVSSGVGTAMEAVRRITSFSERVRVSWDLMRALQESVLGDLREAAALMPVFAAATTDHQRKSDDAVDGAAALVRLDAIAASCASYLNTIARKRSACYLQVAVTTDVFDTSARDVIGSDINPALVGLGGVLAGMAFGVSTQSATAAKVGPVADDLADCASSLAHEASEVADRVAAMVGLWSPTYRPSDVDTIVVAFLQWHHTLSREVTRVKSLNAVLDAAGTSGDDDATSSSTVSVCGLSPQQVALLYESAPEMPVLFTDASAAAQQLLAFRGSPTAAHRSGEVFSKEIIERARSGLVAFDNAVISSWRNHCSQLGVALRRCDDAAAVAEALCVELRMARDELLLQRQPVQTVLPDDSSFATAAAVAGPAGTAEQQQQSDTTTSEAPPAVAHHDNDNADETTAASSQTTAVAPVSPSSDVRGGGGAGTASEPATAPQLQQTTPAVTPVVAVARQPQAVVTTLVRPASLPPPPPPKPVMMHVGCTTDIRGPIVPSSVAAAAVAAAASSAKAAAASASGGNHHATTTTTTTTGTAATSSAPGDPPTAAPHPTTASSAPDQAAAKPSKQESSAVDAFLAGDDSSGDDHHDFFNNTAADEDPSPMHHQPADNTATAASDRVPAAQYHQGQPVAADSSSPAGSSRGRDRADALVASDFLSVFESAFAPGGAPGAAGSSRSASKDAFDSVLAAASAAAAAAPVATEDAAIDATFPAYDGAVQTEPYTGYFTMVTRYAAAVQTDPIEVESSPVAVAPIDMLSPPPASGGALVDDGTPERRLERAMLALGREQVRRLASLRDAGVQVAIAEQQSVSATPFPADGGGSLFPEGSPARVRAEHLGAPPPPDSAMARVLAGATAGGPLLTPEAQRVLVDTVDSEDVSGAPPPSAGTEALTRATRDAACALLDRSPGTPPPPPDDDEEGSGDMAGDREQQLSGDDDRMNAAARRALEQLHSARATRIATQRSELTVYEDALSSLRSDVEYGAARVSDVEAELRRSQEREQELLRLVDDYHDRLTNNANAHEALRSQLNATNVDMQQKCEKLAGRVDELETQNVALAHRLGGVLTDRQVFSSLAQRGRAALHRDASVSVDHSIVAPLAAAERFAAVRTSSTSVGADSVHSNASSTPSRVGQGATWRALADPQSGRTYYYNPETKQTTWERPAELSSSSERHRHGQLY